MTTYNVYESYTKHPISGEGAWDIMSVIAFSEEDAATVKGFDKVIYKEGSMSNSKSAVIASGLAVTEAVYKSVYGVAA